MTIEKIRNRLKQNLESGKAEASFRALHLTDEQVEECLNACRKAVEGYYGDDIFSPEHNKYLGAMIDDNKE